MDANSMFVREKRVGAYSYLYLVETVRENGKTKQRIIRSLGRTEDVEARGDLDRLARSAARPSHRGCAAVRASVHRERLPWRGGGDVGRAPLRVRRGACGVPDGSASSDGVGLGPRL